MAADADGTDGLGARERKRRETRARVSQAAMALFLERGFEATTVDQIARAAGISRRGFFHHFAAKEDVIVAWQDAFTESLVDAIARQPADRAPMEAAEAAVLQVAGSLERGQARALSELSHATPALRAREHAKHEAMERAMAGAFARRLGLPADDARARLIAVVAAGAMRVAAEAWLAEEGDETPDKHAREAFRTLRTELFRASGEAPAG